MLWVAEYRVTGVFKNHSISEQNKKLSEEWIKVKEDGGKRAYDEKLKQLQGAYNAWEGLF
jgi:hypothetical protein